MKKYRYVENNENWQNETANFLQSFLKSLNVTAFTFENVEKFYKLYAFVESKMISCKYENDESINLFVNEFFNR